MTAIEPVSTTVERPCVGFGIDTGPEPSSTTENWMSVTGACLADGAHGAVGRRRWRLPTDRVRINPWTES